MTLLKNDARVMRETATLYRRRPLVIALRPRYLEIREKGRRDTLPVEYGALYDFAQKLRFRQQQAEKREQRRGKK